MKRNCTVGNDGKLVENFRWRKTSFSVMQRTRILFLRMLGRASPRNYAQADENEGSSKRKEGGKGKNGRKECWWILNAEAQTFLLADSLWIQRYYTYSRCISYASYRRAEKLDETLFACNDREIHCFDKRRLDFSLVESIDAFASPLV